MLMHAANISSWTSPSNGADEIFVMQTGGQQQRVPLPAGMALATGAYALLRTVGF